MIRGVHAHSAAYIAIVAGLVTTHLIGTRSRGGTGRPPRKLAYSLFSVRSPRGIKEFLPEVMHYNDFAGWVRARLDAGPDSDDIDAARKLGVPSSSVARWLSVRHPTRVTTREVAARSGVSIQEVLVAGGYMTSDEAVTAADTLDDARPVHWHRARRHRE